MAEPDPFDFVCERLEAATELSALEARGVLRLALRRAGFDARRARAAELAVVVEKILPQELRLRAVEDAESLCGMLHAALGTRHFAAGRDETAPEEVFRRLGGGL